MQFTQISENTTRVVSCDMKNPLKIIKGNDNERERGKYGKRKRER